MQKSIILLLLYSVFWTGNLYAQDSQKLPATNFLNEQRSSQLLNQTRALSEPSLIKAQARLLRDHYEALIAVGFSKDEAMRIIIAMASRDKT